MKNIPIPSEHAYLKSLTDKVEHFIRRLRWKAYWYDKKSKDNANEDEEFTSTWGFKTTKTPPTNVHLKAFEDELYEMIRNIEFTTVRDQFLSQLSRDVKEIRSSEKVLVFADKSTNIYEVEKEEYNTLLNNNITTTYKKTNSEVKDAIDREAKVIADKLGLTDKMERLAEKPAFVTLKDHKENFRSHPKCRLINPAKSEVGHVSKAILERVVAAVAEETQLNQWRNTSTVIEWFKNTKYKSQSRFIKFDICEFYPSISEELLDKAIAFARTITPITDSELNIIKHSRKSLLFSNTGTWIKKNNELFDVTMGSFDGAEVCELVGLYLLNRLTQLTGNKVGTGLYRDDGLAVIRSTSGRRMDKLRKDIIELFRSEGLSITIETNLRITDFLDVTFNLGTGKYYPYRKPENKPLYIDARSNHPRSVIKELPKMINRRISDLSCDAEQFEKAKAPYEEALRESGYEPEFKFTRTVNKRIRNRKVLWFNPPYSKSVKSNVGEIFLDLVQKHFTPQHHFRKIFNANTIKLSYSCMPNVANIIKQTNSHILHQPATNRDGLCNCRTQECPMEGKCLDSCIAYQADVTAGGEEYRYIGIVQGEWKERWNDHNTSFRLRQYENKTELSKLIWSLKDEGTPYSIKWSVAAHAHPYKCGSRKCDLCMTEKTLIARTRHPGILNKRSEIVSKCRHRNKFTLNSL